MKTYVPLMAVVLLVFSPLLAPGAAAEEVSSRDAEVKAPVVPEEEAASEADASPAQAAPQDFPEPLDRENTVRVVYPKDRPEWVEAPPMRMSTKANGEIDRVAVSSGPHFSLGEARRQLEEAIKRSADDYVNRHVGSNQAARFVSYQIAPSQTYEERPEFSVGPMHQAHALLEFDESFRRNAEQDWKEALTLSRLLKTGLGAAAMLVLLSVVLGYVRADTATRGYYTRRLRFGAATVILALAAAIYFATRLIPWMI